MGICLLLAECAQGQPVNEKLQTFQKFVNGEIPIKEAIVYRKSEKFDGVILNQEWWRFGYQNGTWFCERLEPDANNPPKLVSNSKAKNLVCGASFSMDWIMDNRYLDMVERAKAVGSSPDTYAQGYRSLMFMALSLGLPRISDVLEINDARIKWNQLAFTTIRASQYDINWKILKAVTTTGRVNLGADGKPVSAEFPGITSDAPAGAVTYEYESTNSGIPTIFVIRYPDHLIRYEFLRLVLGSNDWTKTDGYTPALFGDLAVARTIRVWTNAFSYTISGGKLIPNFETTHPKRIGSLILIAAIAISGSLLTLGYRNAKGNKTTTSNP